MKCTILAGAVAPDLMLHPARHHGACRRHAHADRHGPLLVLKAAWAMDKFGNRETHQQIAKNN